MSKKEKSGSGAQGGKKSGTMKFFLIILPLLAMLTAAIPAFLIVIFGMIPTLLAMIADANKDRSLTACVGAFNFLGVIVMMFQTMKTASTIPDVFQSLMSPITIFFILVSCAIGWIFFALVTPFVATAIVRSSKSEIKSLEKRQADLKSEWGDKVATEN